MKKVNPYSVIIVLIVLAAVLAAISTAVKSIDVNTLDPAIQPYWQVIVYVFTTSAVTPLFTLVANIYGYVTNKLEEPSATRDSIEYQANLVLATYLKLDGYIKGISLLAITAFQGTPYANYAVYVAGAAAFILDIAVRTVKNLAQPAASAPVTGKPATPPVPVPPPQ